MKKSLLFLASAALVLASCSNDVKLDENVAPVGSNNQQEIALSAYAQKPNRVKSNAPIINNVFPNDNDMEVAAYITVPTPAGNYFEKTTFSKGEGATWKGNKYWPLGESKLNFFAVSGADVDAEDITIANNLGTAEVAYTTANSYNAATQSDIMYAFGRGAVTKAGNVLNFPNVNMQFKHALALVDFEVKAFSQTEIDSIKVDSIKLKGATYNGTLTLTNTGATAESGDVSTTVEWEEGDAVAIVNVPSISAATALTNDYARIGEGLMIVPGTGFDSFVIYYSMGGKAYSYEYTPSPAVSSTTANNKYTYRITFKLHQIEIAPTVGDWTNTNNDIDVY